MSNKTGWALTSLAAAIPAAVLSGLLVYSFLKHAQNMTTMFVVLASFTLLMSFLITVSPAGILLFWPKLDTSETEEAAEEEEPDIEAEEAESAEEVAVAEAEPAEEFGEVAEDVDLEADTETVEAAEADDEDIFGEPDDEFADLDFGDFEDEEK